MNPYEPPQTVDSSPRPPLAEEVHPFVRTREGLIRAAAFCVEGGRLQFAAGLAGIVALLLGMQHDNFELFDETLGKLVYLISVVVSAVIYTWGAIKNYCGYAGLAEHSTKEEQAKIYNGCQTIWWVQVCLTTLYLLVHPRPAFPDGFLNGKIRVGILVMFALSYLAASFIQTKALGAWYERFDLPRAEWGYFAGGVAVVICLALEAVLPYFGWRELWGLHLTLSFLLAITAWDFAHRYQTVREALLEPRE